MSGKMSPRSLFYDEKVKLLSDKCCAYCGKIKNLQLDHIIPKNKGGKDAGENLIWACRSCNASKSDTDLMEWYNKKGEFPPLFILRNYMKLVIQYCCENNIMDLEVIEGHRLGLPFSIGFIPLKFPKPVELVMYPSIEIKNQH
ncbi:MAG: HNH endonuclease [bacterium]